MSAALGRPGPRWVEHAVLWHVPPLGFLGAPPVRDPAAAPVPRLRGLVPWLDHLVQLGANVLLLGPIFAAETHGDDTTDHFAVDSRLGTVDDLDHLLAEAHVRGVRVVLDGVFHHVGRSFAPLADVLERGPASPYAGWFRRGPGGELATVEGHDRLVALDHDEPAVVDHVVAVLDHWSGRGVDGWRLGGAYAVPTRAWAEVARRTAARHPDVWLFGEVVHGDYTAFVRDSGLHAVTQHELSKAVWSATEHHDLHELVHALQRHDGHLAHFLPQTFLGNRDVTRLVDRRTLPHALVVLLTVGGVPSIDAGDDHSSTGVTEDPSGDDVFALHRSLIGLRRRHPWLQGAWTAVESLAGETLLYATCGERGQRLLVGLHLADRAVRLRLPEGTWRVEAGTGDVTEGRLGLPAHGWAVLAPA